MAIQWRVARETLLDSVESSRFDEALRLTTIQDGVAIDSYKMGQDGPYLSSVFVVNDDYILEVDLEEDALQFDVASFRNLINFRVKQGRAALVSALMAPKGVPPAGMVKSEPENAAVKYAFVFLKHTDVLQSSMIYFGDDCETWLHYLLQHLPMRLLLGAQ